MHADTADASVLKRVIPDVAARHFGAIGTATLNEAGDLAAADYDVWMIHGGEWVYGGQYSHATDMLSLIDLDGVA